MPREDQRQEIIDQLQQSISADVGNSQEDEIDSITTQFNKTLNDALRSFNSDAFDSDGFIKKMRDLELDNKKDKAVVKNVLNNLRTDYVNVESINQNELLLRRDIYNICTQMPEMHDVIQIIRDAIIECNVATGEVSRTVTFENHESDDDALLNQVHDLEKRHELLMAIKNTIVPKALMNGEIYVQIVPYSKLFAELEAISMKQASHVNRTKPRSEEDLGIGWHEHKEFQESCPPGLLESFDSQPKNLYNEKNIKVLLEAVSPIEGVNTKDDVVVESNGKADSVSSDHISREAIGSILKNIDVYNGSSVLLSEYGPSGLKDLLLKDIQESGFHKSKKDPTLSHFSESVQQYAHGSLARNVFSTVDEDGIEPGAYSEIKGCYIKYLDSLRMLPIRMDRRVIGYYYATTTMDLQTNSANPNGIIDLSYQNYVKDRRMVDELANLIIRSFDKKMLEKNVKLKNEIAEIVMAHKFAEGRLSFIYIPEDEITRFVINEDENGRGHSVLEPSLFPARMYLMLSMYNMLYTLNNNTTRVHYLKSSGLDTDYASQVQRTMRKFQSRRITIDDIYSYSGVLNKVGGIGEMVLPAGRNDYKALETDTIEAARNPFDMEFLEQQRREAISGTGVPSLLALNGLDEVDFAKTLELANTRFLSTALSYKIDLNRGLTKMYQRILKYETDLEDDVIASFRFQFNQGKQPELVITSDMIQNFNTVVELVGSIFFKQSELEDDNRNPTATMITLKKELAKLYLPQLDFDQLNELVDRVKVAAGEDVMQTRGADIKITQQDISNMQ